METEREVTIVSPPLSARRKTVRIDFFSVPYSALASTLLLIEDTSARLEIIRILSNFFRSVFYLSKDDLVHCVYLCVNKVAPEYEGIELGIGETILIKAIADSTGRTVEQLKLDYKSKGDLGLVAEVIFSPSTSPHSHLAPSAGISIDPTNDVQTQTVDRVARLPKTEGNRTTNWQQSLSLRAHPLVIGSIRF